MTLVWRVFLWGFCGRDGRTGTIPGCWSPTHWSSRLSQGLNSQRHRLSSQPGGHKCQLSWGWRLSLWNTRWLSLYIKRFCQENYDYCWLGSAGRCCHLPSPLSLFASLQCTLGVFERGCVSTWREGRTFWIDFLSYFQLTSLSFFDEKVGGVSFIDLRSKRTALSYTAWQGSYRL